MYMYVVTLTRITFTIYKYFLFSLIYMFVYSSVCNIGKVDFVLSIKKIFQTEFLPEVCP